MILQTILTAVLALSGTTTAAAITPRDDAPKPNRTVVGPVPAFQVTGFSAVALPLSLRVGLVSQSIHTPFSPPPTCTSFPNRPLPKIPSTTPQN